MFSDGSVYVTAQQIKSAILVGGGVLLPDEDKRPGKNFNTLARAILRDMGVRKAYGLSPDGSDIVELHRDESPDNADIIDEFLTRGFINKADSVIHMYSIPMATVLIKKVGLKNGSVISKSMDELFPTATYVGGVPVKRIHSVVQGSKKPITDGLFEKRPKGRGRLING